MENAEVAAPPVHCLIVVDMQVGFLTGPEAAPGSRELTGAVDELLTRARTAGAVVVHLRNTGPAGALDEPRTPTWQLQRQPAADELIIDKTHDDGFVGTTLDRDLERRGVRRVAICGIMSEMCVAATARAALERGYGVVLPHTAHGTYDVPAGPGGSPTVSADLAARAAEWSLGDTIEIVAGPGSVLFTAPG